MPTYHFTAYQLGESSNPFHSNDPALSVAVTPERSLVYNNAKVYFEIELSKPVATMAASAITVSAGRVSDFTKISDTLYGAVLTPPLAGSGTITISVTPRAASTDGWGKTWGKGWGGKLGTSLGVTATAQVRHAPAPSVSYDFFGYYLSEPLDVFGGQPHPLVASITPDFEPIYAGGKVKLDVMFNREVDDFTITDIATTAGELSNFAGEGNNYTVVWTAPTSPTSGTTTISIHHAGVMNLTRTAHVDVHWQPTIPVTHNFWGYYLTVPNMPLGGNLPPITATITPQRPIVIRGAPVMVDIVFSVPVTDFTIADIAVSAGSLSEFTDVENENIHYQVVLTPPAVGTGTITITVAMSGVQGLVADMTGQLIYIAPIEFTSDWYARKITSGRSTPASPFVNPPPAHVTTGVTITPRQSTVVTNEVVVVDVVFSRAVTDFTQSDMVLSAGATIAAFTGAGAVYAVEIRAPSSGEGVIVITIPAGSVTGLITDAVTSIRYEPPAPTILASITSIEPSVAPGGQILLTITFSAAVTGLTLSDLTTDCGVLSNLQGSGAVYTVILSAPAGITITLPQHSVPEGNSAASYTVPLTGGSASSEVAIRRRWSAGAVSSRFT